MVVLRYSHKRLPTCAELSLNPFRAVSFACGALLALVGVSPY
jgi:hypothetical protein